MNWLEVEAVSRFIERARVVQYISALPFYQWIYRQVIGDWQSLDALYRERGVIPLRYATQMSADDLRLAGLMDEAPSD